MVGLDVVLRTSNSDTEVLQTAYFCNFLYPGNQYIPVHRHGYIRP